MASVATESVISNIITRIGWNGLEAISAILAFIATLLVIIQSKRQFNKQLETEQEPFIAIADPLILRKNRRKVGNIKTNNNYVEQYEFAVKNVGRGPAIRIIGSIGQNENNNAFFADEYPHSYELSPGEKVETRIDKFRIKEMSSRNINGEENRYFYLFYLDQLKKKYITKVTIKKRKAEAERDTPEFYVVMENNRKKL